MHLLYIVRDPYPTQRPDIVALFGEALVERGVASDIVALRQGDLADRHDGWPGGAEFVHTPGNSALSRAVGGLLNDLRALRRCRTHDGVVVRDKILTAAIALLAHGRRTIIYWASFPMAEHDLARAAMPARPSDELDVSGVISAVAVLFGDRGELAEAGKEDVGYVRIELLATFAGNDLANLVDRHRFLVHPP